MVPPQFQGIAAAANDDERFDRVSDRMNAAIVFDVADVAALLAVRDGRVRAVRPSFRFSSWDVAVRCDADTWDRYRADSPPPFYQDLRSVWINHGLRIEGDQVLGLRHWSALKRLTQLLAAGWDDV